MNKLTKSWIFLLGMSIFGLQLLSIRYSGFQSIMIMACLSACLVGFFLDLRYGDGKDDG